MYKIIIHLKKLIYIVEISQKIKEKFYPVIGLGLLKSEFYPFLFNV
jgi:hypothetical protein